MSKDPHKTKARKAAKNDLWREIAATICALSASNDRPEFSEICEIAPELVVPPNVPCFGSFEHPSAYLARQALWFVIEEYERLGLEQAIDNSDWAEAESPAQDRVVAVRTHRKHITLCVDSGKSATVSFLQLDFGYVHKSRRRNLVELTIQGRSARLLPEEAHRIAKALNERAYKATARDVIDAKKRRKR
jgi:hypothetical protein